MSFKNYCYLNEFEDLNKINIHDSVGGPFVFSSIGDKHIPIEGPASSYEITSLQCNTTYKIRIQAINSIGEGPYSSVLRVTTLKFPPSPPKLQCIGTGHNYLKLKWGEGKNMDYSEYCVEVMNSRYKEFQCVYRG